MLTGHMVAYYLTSIKRHHFRGSLTLRAFAPRRHAIVYIVDGAGSICLNGRTHHFRAGSCALLTSGMSGHVQLCFKRATQLYMLHYEGLLLDFSSPAKQIVQSGLAVGREEGGFLLQCPQPIAILCEQLNAQRKQPGQAAQQLRQQQFQQLIVSLHLSGPMETAQGQPDPEGGIRQAVDHMKLHYMQPLELASLPQLAGMTPSSFCRAFKRVTGLTPGGYLTSLRLDKARELLAERAGPLKDIAKQVGFQDELYFSRVFKQKEGMAPSLYRRKRQQRIAIVTNLFLQDHLLALGHKPLASPSFPSSYAGGFPSYLRAGLSGTVPLNAERRIHWQDVAGLEPDVVIKMSFRNNPYDRAWSESGSLYLEGFPDWTGYLETLSAIVGQENRAEAWVKRIARAEEQARDALVRFTAAGSWAVIRVMRDDLRLYTGARHSFTQLLYRDLGFQAARLEPGYSYRPHALHELAELDPERILVVWSDTSALERLRLDPVWQGLRAVAANQVYVPDSVGWDSWGPIGREHTIRACVEYFSAFG